MEDKSTQAVENDPKETNISQFVNAFFTTLKKIPKTRVADLGSIFGIDLITGFLNMSDNEIKSLVQEMQTNEKGEIVDVDPTNTMDLIVYTMGSLASYSKLTPAKLKKLNANYIKRGFESRHKFIEHTLDGFGIEFKDPGQSGMFLAQVNQMTRQRDIGDVDAIIQTIYAVWIKPLHNESKIPGVKPSPFS